MMKDSNFSPKIKKKAEMLVSFQFNTVLEVPASTSMVITNKQRNKQVIKSILIGNKQNCLYLQKKKHHDYGHRKSYVIPKSCKTNEFSNIMRYKMHIQKSIVFPQTNNKWKTKFKIPLTMMSENAKYLGINLTKYVRYLYTENYKRLLGEILKDRNKWGTLPCS